MTQFKQEENIVCLSPLTTVHIFAHELWLWVRSPHPLVLLEFCMLRPVDLEPGPPAECSTFMWDIVVEQVAGFPFPVQLECNFSFSWPDISQEHPWVQAGLALILLPLSSSPPGVVHSGLSAWSGWVAEGCRVCFRSSQGPLLPNPIPHTSWMNEQHFHCN